jgi:D-sedoheptulose 7-phosphate isomerase
MNSIALTGEGGGKVGELCDILIEVPSKVTPRVQELHLAIYHYICEQVEFHLSEVAA